jgi:hypothetical protein
MGVGPTLRVRWGRHHPSGVVGRSAKAVPLAGRRATHAGLGRPPARSAGMGCPFGWVTPPRPTRWVADPQGVLGHGRRAGGGARPSDRWETPRVPHGGPFREGRCPRGALGYGQWAGEPAPRSAGAHRPFGSVGHAACPTWWAYPQSPLPGKALGLEPQPSLIGAGFNPPRLLPRHRCPLASGEGTPSLGVGWKAPPLRDAGGDLTDLAWWAARRRALPTQGVGLRGLGWGHPPPRSAGAGRPFGVVGDAARQTGSIREVPCPGRALGRGPAPRSGAPPARRWATQRVERRCVASHRQRLLREPCGRVPSVGCQHQ